ncbi:MAG: 3'-5' exonuclease [Tannerella sp.]|jgi:DNA polymerase-3 subunit epsilon|nr:3'-5' exonuclease [Tannerella sp.]
MEDFAAIDFETANADPGSICSVGVVIVRGGVVSERIYELVKPEPEWYAYWNTRVHGLTENDTMHAPTFDRVWRRIASRIEGLPLVAHNSVFDERCLRAVHKIYGMDYPDYTFHCTCRASRKVFGKSLPDHRLHTVAAHCGYDLRNHHHALADAEACAVIARRIL